MFQYSKENLFLEQNLYLHNQMHNINQNTSKRKEEEFKTFSRITKDKRFTRLVQLSIWRGGVSILKMNI